MASSKVMVTTSPKNPDLPRQPSLCSSLSTLLADLQQQNNNNNNNLGDPSQNLGSMSLDDLLKNIYSAPTAAIPEANTNTNTNPNAPFVVVGGASISREGSFSLPKEIGNKSVDEVWKEIVAGGSSDQVRAGAGEGASIEEMTLEDFLTKAGAVREEDVRVNNNHNINNNNNNNQVGVSAGVYGADAAYQVVGPTPTPTRGKRRAVEEPPLDKATQQKHRRMIKNRESAARSRERKQAYTVELESLVTQLEEEKARLLREEAEQNKERFKQLMENLIPVVEKKKPTRVLRRVQSVHW